MASRNGSVRSSGQEGDYWSGVAQAYSSPTSASAYDLYFRDLDVNSDNQNYHQRWYGFPVRCLVYWLSERKAVYNSLITTRFESTLNREKVAL